MRTIFLVWLSGICTIGVFELFMALLYAHSHRYKGKAVGKVTDVFRHDYDDHGMEAPTGYGTHVTYKAHYVFEVNGEKYRGYGSISAVSRLTRKVNIRYDIDAPSCFCIAMSPVWVIIPVVIMFLWTAAFIYWGNML